jgi:TPR repeat protein
MYANGTGILADPLEAYRWLSIVAARASGDEQIRAANALKVVAGALSPAQIDDARERARSWMERHKQ